MQFVLHKTQDADNVIGKVLTDELVLDVYLRSDTDLRNPRIRLTGIANLMDYNYCVIPELDRFYFIREINILNPELSEILCEMDYLESYKSKILTMSGLIRRQGGYGTLAMDETGREVSTNYYSDVELEKGEGAVLTVLKGKVVL
jgi:hypothetical protein